MKILTVSKEKTNHLSPFVQEQIDSLKDLNIQIDSFSFRGKGILGYLKALPSLKRKISTFKPNLIHSHYGLSGLLSILQREVPVILTLHGGDINSKVIRPLSIFASTFAAKTIFVSQKMADIINAKSALIIPCGINLEIFTPTDKEKARKTLNLEKNKKYILFSSSFSNSVKNYPLAKEAIQRLGDKNIQLLELKGLSRKEVALLLNAVDLALMTSFSEGSPQFIKEAMACNCPVVSTNVGDVKWLFGNAQGYYIAKSNSSDVGDKINLAINNNNIINGRDRILKLGIDSKETANRIIEVYYDVLYSK